jgi:hypothetical protein
MEDYIREICTQAGWSFDEMIQQYNLNKKTSHRVMNLIIDYKIEHNKDIIYKEDIPKIFPGYFTPNMSQEEIVENIMIDIKHYNLDINNLTIKDSFYTPYLQLYYISTFLEHKTVDIKIALKD